MKNVLKQSDLDTLFTQKLNELIKVGFVITETPNISSMERCVNLIRAGRKVRILISNEQTRSFEVNDRTIIIQDFNRWHDSTEENVLYKGTFYALEKGVFVLSKQQANEAKELRMERAINQQETRQALRGQRKVTASKSYVEKLKGNRGFKTATANKVTVNRGKRGYSIKYSKQLRVVNFPQ